ncbi:solute carrier family 35 member F3-like [Heptranchias perlo]|uniref:solute carrier family 35 member F3-like n=1 Tax=Heptranchias perlo TaxID=212740 RepID=UPI003559EF22
MRKHRVFPLTACNSPVLALTWVEGNQQTGALPTQAVPAGGPEVGEDRPQPRCRPLAALGRLARGLALAACLALSWAGMSQLAKLALRDFAAPFFVAWYSTNWNLLLFPAYCAGHSLISSERRSPLKHFSECSRFLSEDGFSLRALLMRTAPFCVLWILTSYLYLMALGNISAADASALFCCNKAFVFLLSWIVLKDRFMGVRIVAAILSITGIVMMAYADGFRGDSIVGVALVVGSASTSALYKVLFKLLLGSARFGEAAFFLTALGAFNLVFLAWVSVVLYVTRVEHWTSAPEVPWDQLCGLSALLLVFNILINCGVAVTTPTLVSLGVFLSIPVNVAADVYRGAPLVLGDVRLYALLILGLAFLLLLLPEEWDSVGLGLLAKLGRETEEKEEEEKEEESAEGRPQARGRTRGAEVGSSLPCLRRSETRDLPAA